MLYYIRIPGVVGVEFEEFLITAEGKEDGNAYTCYRHQANRYYVLCVKFNPEFPDDQTSH